MKIQNTMEKNTTCEGCKKYDCEDYPSIEQGDILLNRNCLMCKYFKKFNLYTKEK